MTGRRDRPLLRLVRVSG